MKYEAKGDGERALTVTDGAWQWVDVPHAQEAPAEHSGSVTPEAFLGPVSLRNGDTAVIYGSHETPTADGRMIPGDVGLTVEEARQLHTPQAGEVELPGLMVSPELYDQPGDIA
jgi:hypothetical protein